MLSASKANCKENLKNKFEQKFKNVQKGMAGQIGQIYLETMTETLKHLQSLLLTGLRVSQYQVDQELPNFESEVLKFAIRFLSDNLDTVGNNVFNQFKNKFNHNEKNGDLVKWYDLEESEINKRHKQLLDDHCAMLEEFSNL